jgi:hypothetical protein
MKTFKKNKQSGYTLLVMVYVVFLVSIGFYKLTPTTNNIYSIDPNIKIMQQYIDSIASYYYSTTGTTYSLPTTAEQFLVDTRYLTNYKHLRNIYKLKKFKLLINSNGEINGLIVSDEFYNNFLLQRSLYGIDIIAVNNNYHLIFSPIKYKNVYKTE